MKFKNILFVMFFFLFATSMYAQEIKKEEIKKEEKSVFTLSGEFRARFESTPGIDMSGSGNGRAILVQENSPGSYTIGQRARITAHYDNGKFETKFSFQDVRMYGANKAAGKIFSSTNGLGLAAHEAWAMYKFINKDGQVLGLKIGRQELTLDPILLWNKNWTHQGAAFDAVKIQYKNKNLGLNSNLGLSLNSVDYPGYATPFRTLGFFNASKTIGENIKINIIDLYEGFESETVLENGKQDSTYFRNTIGINPVAKYSGLSFNGGFYMQIGNTAGLAGTYGGMMYTANLAYTIAKKYKIGAGYDNYSGRAHDDTSDPTIDKVFIVPYAGCHKYFGNTDVQLKLFGKGYGATDINIKANAKVMKTTSIGLQFHMISFATEAILANGTEFTDVGNNIDFVLTHKFDKKVAVNLGYSLFMPSNNYTTMQLGDGVTAKTHNFVWMMFSFKPNFLKVVK